jgi:hypothetical protein
MEQENPPLFRRPPPPAHVTAVWGAVLHQGMMIPERDTSRAGIILDLWGCGCVELMQVMTRHFPRLWEQFDEPQRQAILASPGDDEFMVLFSLGQFIGDCLVKNGGTPPTPALIRLTMMELVSRYFPRKATA